MGGGKECTNVPCPLTQLCGTVCVCVCFFFSEENFSVKLIFQSVTLTSDAMKKSKQKNNEKKDTQLMALKL